MAVLQEGDDVIARARNGDESAWAELYRAHAGRLIAWLSSLPSGDPATAAEDVAADAWLTAAQKLAGFSGNEDDFAGWLFGIARNISRNRHRMSMRRSTSPRATGGPDGAGATDGSEWGTTPDRSALVDGADLTRRLLARLPRREAEVVACIDVVGLDVPATSIALGITTTAVRVAHHRGLKRLRLLLTAPGERSVFPHHPVAPVGLLESN